MPHFKTLPLFIVFLISGISLFAQKYATVIEYRDTTWEEMRDSFITSDILFDTDQYGLLPGEIRKLDYVIHKAKTHFSYDIELVGYADFRGTDEYNQILADRRVTTVKGYFLLRRLQDSLISSRVIGEVPPKEKVNDPEKDLQPYRHVTLKTTLYYKETMKDSIAEQILVMTCAESDTIINFPNGVKVFVEGCSFPDYRIKDLNFEFKIASSRSDMLRSGLTTLTTGGECLQTSGMLFFSVTNKRGNEVSTDPEMPMIVRAPTKAFEEGLQLYDAVMAKSIVASWSPSDNELKRESSNQTNYYTIETTSSMVKNLDIPTGVFTINEIDPEPYFKIRKFKQKHAVPYLSGERSNLPAAFFHKRKFYYKGATCIPEDEQMVTIYVKKKKRNFIYHKPIQEIKRQKRWFIGKGDRYLIRRRDFERTSDQIEIIEISMAN